MSEAYKEENCIESTKSSFALVKLLPNIVTIFGLCLGAFGFKYAIMAKWELAITFLFLSSLLDTVDGCLARVFDASSKFGAELDSLSDFFNFSVVPSFTLYLWKLHEIKAIGWSATLFFLICGIIRLARFNVSEEETLVSSQGYKFFKGIPTPMASGLILAPIMLSFLKDRFPGITFDFSSVFLIIYTSCISVLMVTNIPTISFQKTKIDRDYLFLFLAIISLLIISLILEPWIVIPTISLFYLLSLPWTFFLYRKNKK